MYNRAEQALVETIKIRGKSTKVSYPDTAYYLPIMLMSLGQTVQRLGDLEESLAEAKKLLHDKPSNGHTYPYFEDTLNPGMAALIAEETIEALKYVNQEKPYKGIWLGFTSDSILRLQGIKLVDGRMPGFATIVGATNSNKQAVELIRGLQERNILVFMAGNASGRCVAEQIAEEGIEMNWDTFLVPFGKDISAAVHALNFVVRAAMTFGGIEPGDTKAAREILLYNKERILSFVLVLDKDEHAPSFQLLEDEKYATAAGAMNFGFPIISDTNSPSINPPDAYNSDKLVPNIPIENIIKRAIEVRGLTVKLKQIPIPIAFGAGFEGERIRKSDVYVQFGGQYTNAFEYLRIKPLNSVTDGKITVIGPEIDKMKKGKAYPLGIVVDVAGAKLYKELESVMERRIHEWISCANGIFHMGQRSTIWIRISKQATQAGFMIKDLGEIIIAKLHNEYSSILSRAQVTIYTDSKKNKSLMKEALEAYRERDNRIRNMNDDDVEEFYSCTLCQSYAPDHVCIITPERLGLCGAYTWLDCNVAHQLDKNGPNKPIKKGNCLSKLKGQWKNVNEFIRLNSNGNVECVNIYSIMENPMTSCGCFECISAVIPEANGIMIVDRDYHDMTPLGITFSGLAGFIGGGTQTPGFLGHGKLYITSNKYLCAEGGIKRIVWMPQALKDEMSVILKDRLKSNGNRTLFNMIATERNATDLQKLVKYLAKVKHPALTMNPILSSTETRPSTRPRLTLRRNN